MSQKTLRLFKLLFKTFSNKLTWKKDFIKLDLLYYYSNKKKIFNKGSIKVRVRVLYIKY